MKKGKFIVIEGLEGAGKTTACQVIESVLHQHGIQKIQFTREPGGTPLAEKLRLLLKEGIDDEAISDKTELLLFYAARNQLVENVIKPALSRGIWIVGDRHDLSTQAYQGAGRNVNTVLLDILHDNVLEGFEPDLTLYLDIDPELGLARAKGRGKLDRIEQESLTFFHRVRERYLALTKDNPRTITIDASQTIDKIRENIIQHVTQWLTQQGQ